MGFPGNVRAVTIVTPTGDTVTLPGAVRAEVPRRPRRNSALEPPAGRAPFYLARLDAEPTLRSQPVKLTAVVRDSVADAVVEPARRISLHVNDPAQ